MVILPIGKRIVTEERISEGKTKLYYADRVETLTWEDLPLVEYMEESAKISVEDINIDAEIPDKLDYISVSGNLYFHLSDASLYSIFDYLEERIGGIFYPQEIVSFARTGLADSTKTNVRSI